MKEWQFWTLTGFGGVFLVLVVLNVYMFSHNRSLQVEVAGRQQFISQSVQLEQLNKEIIVAIANLAVRDKDDELNKVLTDQGIRVTATPKATAEVLDKTAVKGKK